MKTMIGLSLAAFVLSSCADSSPFSIVKDSPEELKQWPNDWLCYANQYSSDEQIEKIRAEFIRRGVHSYWMRSPQAVGPDRRYYCPGIDE